MIYHKGDGARVHAKGPSLRAILHELGWALDQVIVTQLSRSGSDVVMVTHYEPVSDTTWLDG